MGLVKKRMCEATIIGRGKEQIRGWLWLISAPNQTFWLILCMDQLSTSDGKSWLLSCRSLTALSIPPASWLLSVQSVPATGLPTHQNNARRDRSIATSASAKEYEGHGHRTAYFSCHQLTKATRQPLTDTHRPVHAPTTHSTSGLQRGSQREVEKVRRQPASFVRGKRIGMRKYRNWPCGGAGHDRIATGGTLADCRSSRVAPSSAVDCD